MVNEFDVFQANRQTGSNLVVGSTRFPLRGLCALILQVFFWVPCWGFPPLPHMLTPCVAAAEDLNAEGPRIDTLALIKPY